MKLPWPCLAACLLCCCLTGRASAEPPAFAEVKAAWRSSEAKLLDRQGTLLSERRVDLKARRTDWTPLDQVSPALQAAVILAEDQRFFEHSGVDWLAAAKAAVSNWLAERPRGASTISMQVAALIAPDRLIRPGQRSVRQKWQQMQAARDLERTWRKAEILEAYLNLTGFRGDLVGIDAAARALFDKRPAGLDTAESLLLAALIRGPGATPDRVAQRACALSRAIPQGPDCRAITLLARNSLTGRYPIVPAADLAHPLAVRLLDRPGQQRITPLDADLQQTVAGLLDAQLRHLADQGVENAAALVVDNRSGEVLAYVSASANLTRRAENDGVQARRQAGSTLKPFLYALALESRYLTAASALEDSALSLATPGGGYAPENYDHRFRGLASVRVALASSLNIPAVRTLELVGGEVFVERLAALGFTGLDEAADFYGPALALGSLDVSLWELVNAYRSLANAGRFSPLVLTPGERHPTRRVIDARASFIVADILADRAARAPTFGLENALSTPWWSAVKTGTSKDMRDNWCIGFSARHTVGVWVGNFSGEPMRDVSGVSGAAPAWRLVMERLHASTPGAAASKSPKPPRGLVRRDIAGPGGTEPPRAEWFIAGTEPPSAGWTKASPPPVILEPDDGAILALDPDIPPASQRLMLRASHAPESARWIVDDTPLGDAKTPQSWPISRGHHVVQLLDASGRVLDRVAFEVR